MGHWIHNDLNSPFAQGAFRMVTKGEVHRSERKGQPCIAKWFKSGAVYSEEFWELDWRGQKFLAKPFIERYQKFNINTGWVTDVHKPVYPREVVLTDTAILSQTREYGVTDLGPDGISTFFSQHICNKFCRDDWLVPEESGTAWGGRTGQGTVS
ncbi:kinase-like domain-containing protein [Cercophora samala]|uniref:Kinase-like domain-containing protein n=1 Tax=Cercophora samala TaxID=330535 RepID=A0AA39ZH71_9PEZI|nr:kinase-like domain-containing protein [Cercophora samala]